jgi:RNA polymerase sigma-70 factor (sigma-E family)
LDPASESAFRELVHGRSSSYLRTAYLLTGDWHAAEDLLQSALAKVYLAWARLRDRGDLDAYVRAVIVNTQAKAWRRKWRGERPTADVPEQMDRDAISQADDRDRLRRALLTLPQRQRAVVVLRHYDDLSEADVAAQLGCSVGTVKSQSARGLARLREVLDGDQTTMRTPVQIGAQA